MTYFVAEDNAHIRHAGGGYVSTCGWDFPPESVVWAGDYAPEAYDACTECMSHRASPDAPKPELVVVQGVYAIGDDAHLWTKRTESDWHSVCGRTDHNLKVAWADSEWPEAYEACNACLSHVEEDLWQPDAFDEVLGPDHHQDPFQAHRVWVLQDGVDHRARDQKLDRAMCGQTLNAGATPQYTPALDAVTCHACNSAVGRARRGLPPLSTKVIAPATRSNQSMRTKPHNRRGRRSATAPTAAAKRSADRGTHKPKSSGANKDVALYGRKMIVPIRFVRGGAPGLGRRR